MMNEIKRNEIEKVYEILTREELIGLCEKLIDKNEELKAINCILLLVNGISKVVIEQK